MAYEEEIADDIWERFHEARPDVSRQQLRDSAVLLTSTALSIYPYIAGLPYNMALSLGTNLVAASLIHLYLEHGLLDAEAIERFTRRVENDEVDFSESLLPSLRRIPQGEGVADPDQPIN